MGEFAGFVPLGGTKVFTFVVYNSAGVRVTLGTAPTYTIYNPDRSAVMANGTGVASLVTSATTGYYTASHAVSEGDAYAQGSDYGFLGQYTTGSTTYLVDQSFSVS
jgi:hypothetical protein